MKKNTVGPIDIEVLLQHIFFLLQEVQSRVSTAPALMLMYRVVLLDLNYVKIRLTQDKSMLEKATIFSSQPGGFRVNYKEWYDKLEQTRFKWGLYDIDKTDDVCYEDPGFQINELREKHKHVWKKLHDELNEVCSLLSEMHTIINYPSEEKLMQTYDLLRDSYFRLEYVKDRADFETFMISVPKRQSLRVAKLNNQLHDYKYALFNSGFLDEMCCEVLVTDEQLKKFEKDEVDVLNYQREGVLDMLFDSTSKKWDKDIIARYIFSNRFMLTRDQINSFIRYTWQKEDIEKELAGVDSGNNLFIESKLYENVDVTDINPIYTEKLRTRSVYNAYCKVMKETIIPKVKMKGGARTKNWRWPHVFEALKDDRLGFIGKDTGATDFGRAMHELDSDLKATNVKTRVNDRCDGFPKTADKSIITDIVNTIKQICGI